MQTFDPVRKELPTSIKIIKAVLQFKIILFCVTVIFSIILIHDFQSGFFFGIKSALMRHHQISIYTPESAGMIIGESMASSLLPSILAIRAVRNRKFITLISLLAFMIFGSWLLSSGLICLAFSRSSRDYFRKRKVIADVVQVQT